MSMEYFIMSVIEDFVAAALGNIIIIYGRSDIKYTVTHFQQKRYPDPTYQQRKENTNESHVKYVV